MRPVVVRWAHTAEPADAHLLLATVVAGFAGVDRRTVAVGHRCPSCGATEHGRSRATVAGRAGPPVSVARTDGVVVVAVGPVDVGIDVERSGRVDVGAVAPVALTAAEADRLEGLAERVREAAVLRTWVAKEAVLKCLGTGLTVDPSLLSLDAARRRVAAWAGPGRRPALRIQALDLGPDLVASVARRGRRRLHVDAGEVVLSR